MSPIRVAEARPSSTMDLIDQRIRNAVTVGNQTPGTRGHISPHWKGNDKLARVDVDDYSVIGPATSWGEGHRYRIRMPNTFKPVVSIDVSMRHNVYSLRVDGEKFQSPLYKALRGHDVGRFIGFAADELDGPVDALTAHIVASLDRATGHVDNDH